MDTEALVADSTFFAALPESLYRLHSEDAFKATEAEILHEIACLVALFREHVGQIKEGYRLHRLFGSRRAVDLVQTRGVMRESFQRFDIPLAGNISGVCRLVAGKRWGPVAVASITPRFLIGDTVCIIRYDEAAHYGEPFLVECRRFRNGYHVGHNKARRAFASVGGTVKFSQAYYIEGREEAFTYQVQGDFSSAQLAAMTPRDFAAAYVSPIFARLPARRSAVL